VIAKVEWHPGELYPRVGFIVTNLGWSPSTTSEAHANNGSRKSRNRKIHHLIPLHHQVTLMWKSYELTQEAAHQMFCRQTPAAF
jgi:hypothetical protein